MRCACVVSAVVTALFFRVTIPCRKKQGNFPHKYQWQPPGGQEKGRDGILRHLMYIKCCYKSLYIKAWRHRAWKMAGFWHGQPFPSQGMGRGAKMATNGENTWVWRRCIVARAYPCHFKSFHIAKPFIYQGFTGISYYVFRCFFRVTVVYRCNIVLKPCEALYFVGFRGCYRHFPCVSVLWPCENRYIPCFEAGFAVCYRYVIT